MSEIKAGVVVVTRFCTSGAKEFSGYINYIDREDAKRQEHLSEYNLYNDYMDNPEKTTGLFTSDKMKLTQSEKQALKETFKTAQDNDSLMWQTVISFDNRWLAEHGLYDEVNHIIDERKLKELATGAVNKMLKNEGLENAVWSGAIHYNTDNVHIHIATVEPNPQRKRKDYVQYNEKIVNGKTVKEAILDEKGNKVIKEEYVGRFKMRSIELCKKHMVDNIVQQQEQNITLNTIVREQIVKQKKNISISADPELKDKFEELHTKMPRSGNRGLWNYNNNAMAALRPLVDELSTLYMKKYHPEEFKQFRELLKSQSDNYKTAYGKESSRDFENNKIDDLYSRMGNAILKEMREYDKQVSVTDEMVQTESADKVMDEKADNNIDANINDAADRSEKKIIDEAQMAMPDDIDILDINEGYHYKWTEEFKAAKKYIFGTKKEKPNYKKAFALLKSESEKGNALAVYELGDIYRYGRGVEIDQVMAEKYYKKSLEMFQVIYESKSHDSKTSTKDKGYMEYRIGKFFNMGLGTEKDYTVAREWFEKASRNENRFAHYSLGNIYFYGQEVDQNYNKALDCFLLAEKADGGNAYASYKIGDIFSKGKGVEVNQQEADEHFKLAFDGFLRMEEKQANDNLEYRIGVMLQQGIGTEKDEAAAKEYFEKSAKSGNSYAQYNLANIYLKSGNIEDVKVAMDLLEKAATKGKNVMAQYSLGKIYLSDQEEIHDTTKAIEWLKLAAKNDNDYAAYMLGKLYNNKEEPEYDQEQAIKYFSQAAESNNEYAQYSLGKLYLETDSLNMEKAEYWLQKSSDQGNQYAQYTLGKFYLTQNVPKYDKAVYWLEKSAEQSNVQAQYKLGKLYLQDEMKNYDKAEYWLMKASNQNNEFAKYSLAKLYLNEESGKFNFDDGMKLLNEVAETGNQYAQFSIGMIYLKGEYVPRDIDAAKHWIGLAADQGNEIAKEVLTNIEKNGVYKPKLRLKTGKGRGFALDRALAALKKTLKNEAEKTRNMREHERLVESQFKEEMEHEKE